MGKADDTSMTTLVLTNDHLCSHTDGGRSTYVFYTDPTVVLSPTTELHRDTKPLQSGPDDVKLDRD
jgi:hypothetical protein